MFVQRNPSCMTRFIAQLSMLINAQGGHYPNEEEKN